MSVLDCRIDVLSEWMNVIDTSSISSSSPKTPCKILEDEWVNLPEKLTLSRHSSYGAVFETEAILNLLGIQKSGSTNSIGISELWEVNAQKEAETKLVSESSTNTSLVTESNKERNQSGKWDLFKWCLPKKMIKPAICPPTNLNKSSKLSYLNCILSEIPQVNHSSLMINGCFDIDEEEDDDEDEDDGYIDPKFLVSMNLTKTF